MEYEFRHCIFCMCRRCLTGWTGKVININIYFKETDFLLTYLHNIESSAALQSINCLFSDLNLGCTDFIRNNALFGNLNCKEILIQMNTK